MLDFNSAACVIQRAWRSHLNEVSAARVIQDTWRSYANRAIYKSLKEAVLAQTQGDPATVLRCLSMHEAQLAEPAVGLHLRFRLGGTDFPPAIYYKIFTHRPVADMCAFGPRNYARELQQKTENEVDENKYPADWYHRSENNPWKKVDFLSMQPAMQDDGIKTNEWRHLAKKTRKAARKKHNERRKAAWASWLQLSEHPEEEAALLAWTQHLDFEQYMKEWISTGCSAAL